MMHDPVLSICCARISMCAHAGVTFASIRCERLSREPPAESEEERTMAELNIQPNIADPDVFYEALIDAHRDLDPVQSQLLNAELILLLANHIGDLNVLTDALRRARANTALGVAARDS
jgi:Protein of unknown function (DUF2783)